MAVVEEHLARRRQRDVVPVTVQQDGADFLFQLFDLHAERGLRDVQPFGGPPEGKFFRRRDEVTQVPEFHLIVRSQD